MAFVERPVAAETHSGGDRIEQPAARACRRRVDATLDHRQQRSDRLRRKVTRDAGIGIIGKNYGTDVCKRIAPRLADRLRATGHRDRPDAPQPTKAAAVAEQEFAAPDRVVLSPAEP